MTLKLTPEEEKILRGEFGEARAKALEVIIKVAESLDAPKLVEIRHAHISGVSYGTIGEAGLDFIERFHRLGASFSVPTTVNPIGYDNDNPFGCRILDITREFIQGQEAILRDLIEMGADPVLTCTPYKTRRFRELGLEPGVSVAWGESSAVAYANTVLGLKTNREGGPLALLAAIAGRTYYYGLQISENRIPRVSYAVEPSPVDEIDAGIIAEILGEVHEDQYPPLIQARLPSGHYRDIVLRELSAGLGAAGSIGMAVIPGVTPLERSISSSMKNIEISKSLLLSRRRDLAPVRDVDLIFVGCPHSGYEDLIILDYYLKEKVKIPFLITISRDVYETHRDVVSRLSRKGVKFVRSTCLIVSRLKTNNISIATNSYKAYFYLRKRVQDIGILTLPSLAKLAMRG